MGAVENQPPVVQHPTLADLRVIETFRDLSDADLEWLAEHMVLIEAEVGDVVIQAGAPADRMIVLFEGEISGAYEGPGNDSRYYVSRAGRVTGLLPFSRLTQIPLTIRAMTHTRAGSLHKDHFPDMLARIPALQQRLVAVLTDRVRETTRADQEREKLVALGRLSAGLAHELNNPAAALQRAADALGEAVVSFRTANLELGKLDISAENRQFLTQLEYDWAKSSRPPVVLDSLERSDREEEVAEWMKKHNVRDAWNLAPALVDAGCSVPLLEVVAANVDSTLMTEALIRLTASISISRLVEEIKNSTNRISELVKSVKQYSYMDQTPEQDIDIHDGIDNTLIMLKHELKNGIEVVRKYDRSLPKIAVRGSELNQVWTNLITNAIDAMQGKGKLEVRTCRRGEMAIVEVIDNGPGIPPEIRDRIFEPFFTTKSVNKGSGLGLDTVFRIVSRHHGNIHVESQPGRTCFIVTLPFHTNLV